jgi:hypothetical protein
METIERPINIEIRYVFGDFSGTKSSGMLMEYTMAPEPERLFRERDAFDGGDPATCQNIVNMAYWQFLKDQDAEVESHLLPEIPFTFDTSENEAVITLQDGYSIRVWVDLI